MGIRVVSKRKGGTKPVAGETVIYIGRPNVLGNPFVMNSESQRNEVIAKYKQWLQREHGSNPVVAHELNMLAKRVRNGENIALECWCAPCACHGDVIIEAVNWINSKG